MRWKRGDSLRASTTVAMIAFVVAMIAASGPSAAQISPSSGSNPAGTVCEPSDNQSTAAAWLRRQIDWISGWVSDLRLSGAKTATPGQSATPPMVTTSRPLSREIVEWDEYTGRFEPVEMVEVRARVSGYLTTVHFKDGESVKVGDILYTIDPRPFERALGTAQAELELAKTRVENAAKDVDRGRPLVEKRILSEKVFDDRENLMRDAEASVKVADAKVKAAELELSFTRITAPIAGRMSRSNVTSGNYVSAGGTNGATLLTTIVQQDPIFVYFDIGENNTLKYKRLAQAGHQAGATIFGAPVQVALPDEAGYPHDGRLDFSDNRLDPGTGTLRARAQFVQRLRPVLARHVCACPARRLGAARRSPPPGRGHKHGSVEQVCVRRRRRRRYGAAPGDPDRASRGRAADHSAGPDCRRMGDRQRHSEGASGTESHVAA
jgi:RND family efflux transporter MFP subunit